MSYKKKKENHVHLSGSRGAGASIGIFGRLLWSTRISQSFFFFLNNANLLFVFLV